MERLRDLLEKIEQPLLFSSRDDYRHLPLVRDLETTILTLLDRLADQINASPIGAELSVTANQITDNLQNLFKKFDTHSPARKREIIQESMQLLNELKILTSAELAREDAAGRAGVDRFPETNAPLRTDPIR